MSAHVIQFPHRRPAIAAGAEGGGDGARRATPNEFGPNLAPFPPLPAASTVTPAVALAGQAVVHLPAPRPAHDFALLLNAGVHGLKYRRPVAIVSCGEVARDSAGGGA